MERRTQRDGSSRADVRASDADRERAAELLRHHYGAGRLSDDELSDRVGAVYGARSMSDLKALTADLPSARGSRRDRRGGTFAASVRIHATIYVVVNVMLVAIWAASGGGYFWPVWSILGWGIGLGCHAAPLLARRPTSRRRDLGPIPALAHHPLPTHPTSTSVDEMASTVATERPSLRPAAAPDGTVTILFSDIEGSTAINERLGDVRWLDLLRAHNRIVREQVQACGGFEVKSQGDGFMIAFPSARRAIHCARDPGSGRGRVGAPPGRADPRAHRSPHRGGDPRGGRLLWPERGRRGAHH